jgi:hypothetical protein
VCTATAPFAIAARVSGLQPNTQYGLRATLSSGGIASTTFLTDSTGSQDNIGEVFATEPFEFRVVIFLDPNANLIQDPGEATVIDREFIVDRPCQDARPKQPVTKDECKNGGWRSFAGFRSQGECVAFVQRQPQP